MSSVVGDLRQPIPAAAGADERTGLSASGSGRARPGLKRLMMRAVAASQAGGAKESGLSRLIGVHILAFAADAMVTVALAGTVFFSAAPGQQKGNVLGYLLITMAPFAVVAPVIGPVLDRVGHGRRWALAATAFGRTALAVSMAVNFHNVLVLFPLALGSLVLSKAYGVIRATAVPRITPPSMTLVSVNARLSIFGLCATAIGGGFMAGFLALTRSYPLALSIAGAAFALTGWFAVRLPARLDSPNVVTPDGDGALVAPAPPHSNVGSAIVRSRLGFGRLAEITLFAESALRWAGGFLTIFLAFYIEHTWHGFNATIAFTAVLLGSGLGQFAGTVSGARIKITRPEALVMGSLVACGLTFLVTAVTFSLASAVICVTITSATNSLGKVSLDSVIQRDVAETLRSRAFSRSETLLQLTWVVGAAVGVVLPSDRGHLALAVGTIVVASCVAVLGLRYRASARIASEQNGP